MLSRLMGFYNIEKKVKRSSREITYKGSSNNSKNKIATPTNYKLALLVVLVYIVVNIINIIEINQILHRIRNENINCDLFREMNISDEEIEDLIGSKENYINKGYEIKEIYHVFENVVSYIPSENLENLNILKIEKDKFDMKNFIDTVATNLDEAIDSKLISIDMKESELTPRLYVKSNEGMNTKFVVFGTDISSYSQGILCANKEIIKDLDVDMGDVEISNTRDIGYIVSEDNGYLTFKIANYNSQTSNNNQIAQIVDYSGVFKPMMIEFVKQFVK